MNNDLSIPSLTSSDFLSNKSSIQSGFIFSTIQQTLNACCNFAMDFFSGTEKVPTIRNVFPTVITIETHDEEIKHEVVNPLTLKENAPLHRGIKTYRAAITQRTKQVFTAEQIGLARDLNQDK